MRKLVIRSLEELHDAIVSIAIMAQMWWLGIHVDHCCRCLPISKSQARLAASRAR